jgi:hypothetical protein
MQRSGVVVNRFRCTCGVCEIERSIASELAQEENQARFNQVIAGNEALSEYPTVCDLVTRLHACRTLEEGTHLSDQIFGALIASSPIRENADFLERVLLLALMPAVHANVRQVSASYPFLLREDISQHALTVLVQFLRSDAWRARSSHFAFSVTRKLRRSLFLWARDEFRSTPDFATRQDSNEVSIAQSAEDSFERNAILRRFLGLCHERAHLTADDLNLLIELKLEGTSNGYDKQKVGRSSNAFRQKVKRLMNKLRECARVPAHTRHHHE